MKTRYLLGLPFMTLFIGQKEIEVLIDTGFNGSLLLPQTTIHELGLKKIGFAQYAMADGAVVETEVFVADVNWLEKERKVSVIASQSDVALLGMELLRQAKTTLAPAKNILMIDAIE